MLRVNVGLSRKLTANFNSTGFTLNLEGEVNAPLDDPDAVIERIKEYYDLADEALRQQVERHEGGLDPTTQAEPRAIAPVPNRPAEPPPPPPAPRPQPAPNHQPRTGPGDDAATPNQIRFIQALAKMQRLSSAQLDAAVNDTLGHLCPLHQLTKKQAAGSSTPSTRTPGRGGEHGPLPRPLPGLRGPHHPLRGRTRRSLERDRLPPLWGQRRLPPRGHHPGRAEAPAPDPQALPQWPPSSRRS
jgi:hypothetical protein